MRRLSPPENRLTVNGSRGNADDIDGVPMRRLRVRIGAIVALALAGVLVNMEWVAAQQPACLHGQNEAPDQVARRQRALGFTRHINTLQAAAYGQNQVYPTLAQLPVVEAMPQGFAVHLASDGPSYAFSVKDTLDPCRFGYFSDQDGM